MWGAGSPTWDEAFCLRLALDTGDQPFSPHEEAIVCVSALGCITLHQLSHTRLTVAALHWM